MTHTLRSRGFALLVHGALWLLVALAVLHLQGRAPAYRESQESPPPPQSYVPVGKLAFLLAPGAFRVAAATNGVDPFYTSHFAPPPAPPRPPPTTRKVDFTYQGFYETVALGKQTIIKVADAFVVSSVGGPVATRLFVADAGMQTVVLTNDLGVTNLLRLNTRQEIEIPLK